MVAIAALAIVVTSAALFVVSSARARQRAQATVAVNRGVEAMRAERRDEARALFLQSLRLDPRQPAALMNLGVMALQDSLLTTADSLFTIMVDATRTDRVLHAAALYNLANVDLQRGAPGVAATHLRESLALDSTNVEAANNLGWALIENHQPADALAVLERALQTFGEEKHLLKNAALAADQLGKRFEALRYVQRSLAADPNYADALALRTRLVSSGGETP